MKRKIFLILIIVMVLAAGYFYFDNKKSQENANKVQWVLSQNIPVRFYQKESNKFCIKAENDFEEKSVAEDIAWVLELNKTEVREIRMIECEGGERGILIR
jgi:hypothetical protein